MEIKKPDSFWDVLIWVTVLLTGLMGMEVLLNHFYPKGGRGIFLLLLFLLLILRESSFFQKRVGENFRDILSWVITLAASVETFFGMMDKNDKDSSWIVWVFPLIVILMAFRLYRDYRKKEEEARKLEELLREPRKLLSEALSSDMKALILLFNARLEEVSFEVDDRMVLYSLPDNRFLVLFRKQVSLEDFLRALTAFRTEVNADEDAIGFYGQTFYGVKPDDLQAYVSDLAGTCRVVPFDLDSDSLTGAEPV
jgi:DNA-binding transcriptional ArsR family regulator